MASNSFTNSIAYWHGAYLTKRRAGLVIVLLIVLLVVAAIVALALGSEAISFAQLWSNTLSREQEVILFNLRLPRIALAVGSGAALALAGAAFQALLRNPLADPYVLGVSSGAALGAIVGMLFASQITFARPLLSFAGAAAATVVVYLLAHRTDDPARLILAGVVISTLLASLMVLLTTLADDIRLRNITFWLLGDLSSGSHELIGFLVFAVVLGAVVLVANARALNLMLIGERDAFALGVETARVRWIVFVTASLLTAAAVSTGGAIGYVGLVVPHLIRLASGTDNRLVLPASALAGALLVLFADTTARTVIAPRELPTGAITALVGAPVLVYLLIGRKRLRTIGDGKLEIRDWRLEIGEEETGIEDEKLEIGVKKTEIGDEKLEIGDGGLEAEESNPHLLLPNTQSVLPTPQPPLRTPHSALRNQLSNLQSPILLRLQDVQFSYDHEILTGINLEVHTGEVVALLGPNGAGKSTLLNLAAGKLQPQAGEIFLQENPLTACSRREIARQTALVAQASDLHFPLTALEYVLAGRFANTTGIGFDTPGDIALALESLAATDTVQFAARHFNQLSSGEKQRVVLARALAQQPQLLLLDEPTANLDLAHQLALLKLVTQLTREQQLGALFVTHEINLAAEFADRIALLKDGKILACGTPNEVMTAELLSQVFGAPLLVTTHPHSGKPLISLTGTTP